MLEHQIDTINDLIYTMGHSSRLEEHQSAFAQLYMSYQPILCRFAMRKGWDMDESEDLVQDLFCTLWVRREQFFPSTISRKAQLDHWLGNTLWSRSSNLRVKTMRLTSIDQESVSNEVRLATATIDMENQYDLKEYEKILEEAIKKLPLFLRVTYNFKTNKDYTMKQTASMVGVSITRAKNSLAEAKSRIQTHMLQYYQSLISNKSLDPTRSVK